MDNIIISTMELQDLNSIKNVLLKDFDNFWTYNVFKEELSNPNSKYIVAKIDNTVVGFAGIWKTVDVIHITNIVTKKIFRRNGIGSILLKNLINLSKNMEDVTSITLEVNENNIPAKKLYEKFGFKIVGLRKKYYNNTNDAILMTKILKGETNEKNWIKLQTT